jgi:dolichol-phosphate mannosyltransferase
VLWQGQSNEADDQLAGAEELLSLPPRPAAPLQLAIIIPTLNEVENVRPLCTKLERALDGIIWEAVFVDDNSRDGTADLLREIGIGDRRIRVLERVGRRGLSSAVVEGMLGTAASVLAVIDADMQHDETILPDLYRAVAYSGIDLAVGSRYVGDGGCGNWSERRQLISRTATALASLVVKTPLSDPMSGFFVIARRAFAAAVPRLSTVGFKILVDIVASSPRALVIKEIPYQFAPRVHGESKLDTAVAWEYMMLLVDKLFGRLVPVRFFMFAIVGSIGLAVHLFVLGTVLKLSGVEFKVAQASAVFVAMTFNFVVNNALTYRDQRLKGARMVTGLLWFYGVCLMGAFANVGVGAYIYDQRWTWWVAGAAGAIVGAVWNYSVSSIFTWRK